MSTPWPRRICWVCGQSAPLARGLYGKPLEDQLDNHAGPCGRPCVAGGVDEDTTNEDVHDSFCMACGDIKRLVKQWCEEARK